MVDMFGFVYLMDHLLDSPVFLWNITSPFLSLRFKQNSLKSLVPWVEHNWGHANQIIISFKHRGQLRNELLTQSFGSFGTIIKMGHMHMSLTSHGTLADLEALGFKLLKANLSLHETKRRSQSLERQRHRVLMTWVSKFSRP